MSQKKVDYLVIGLGASGALGCEDKRMNAGSIFVNYLSNCIAMQELCLSLETETTGELTKIPDGFVRPTFQRMHDLGADIFDAEFAITQDDMKSTGDAVKLGVKSVVVARYRIVQANMLAKPEDFGKCVQALLDHYCITAASLKFKLLVVYGDTMVLPGRLSIQSGSDTRGVDTIRGLPSIIAAVGTDFTRYRLGLGCPKFKSQVPGYMGEAFALGDEVNLFGKVLDVSGQALQHYLSFKSLALTNKKFSNQSPKDPKVLPGLQFPIDLVDPQEIKGNKE